MIKYIKALFKTVKQMDEIEAYSLASVFFMILVLPSLFISYFCEVFAIVALICTLVAVTLELISIWDIVRIEFCEFVEKIKRNVDSGEISSFYYV